MRIDVAFQLPVHARHVDGRPIADRWIVVDLGDSSHAMVATPPSQVYPSTPYGHVACVTHVIVSVSQ